ncbi:MAG: hypothetical protein ACRDZ4_13730 [Egibacteraceae bacterium]
MELLGLRLVLDGETLAEDTYTGPTRTRRGVVVQRLLVGPLTQRLRQSATLVLDAVDELHEPTSGSVRICPASRRPSSAGRMR